MRPKEPSIGRIYGLVKDHKETTRKIPPLRPICSGNGTMTEQISKFVDYHSRCLIENISSHLDDTAHFLRELESIKSSGISMSNVVPVSIDVK